MTICAAYFTIAAGGMGRSRNEDAAAKLEDVNNLLLERPRHFNPDEAVLARYGLVFQGMLVAIDSNTEMMSEPIAP